MFDLEISLEDRPGELARMGEALTKGSISVEGVAASGLLAVVESVTSCSKTEE